MGTVDIYSTEEGAKFGVVDLFCGAGGLSKGFEMAGFEILYASDINRSAMETYTYNNRKTMCELKNVEEIDGRELVERFSKIDRRIDLVIGGPPCQGFSLAGSIGRKGIDDARNHLFMEYARILNEIRPKFFVLENVASLARQRRGVTLNNVLETLNESGYSVDYKILDSAYYGTPQHRRRVFIIGNRLGIKNPFPKEVLEKTDFKTVKDAIGDLPPLSSGENYPLIPNHEAMLHSEEMLLKMSFVKDGGGREQIPSDLRPKSGDIRKYVRLASFSPSFCVTGDMRKVFHYEQNRALTVRELARLQTFPDDYVFMGSRMSQQQQVGDAVPPLLAKEVALSILSELKLFA